MPDVVGMVLQDAQDALQALGSYVLDQEDASGAGRLQINDSNWTVCSQEPAAGEKVPVTTMVTLASVKLDEDCPGSVAAPDAGADEGVVDEPEPQVPEDDPLREMTVAQEQAVRKALSYLDFSAFSKKGLIDQLEFEGFSTEDATFAVENITVSWNDQAVSKAEDYLAYSAFSKSGLVDQLEFEGFTSKQAKRAVDAIEVDWNEQAALKAQSYLDFQAFSRSGLIDQLIFEGFTREQAEFGADSVGL